MGHTAFDMEVVNKRKKRSAISALPKLNRAGRTPSEPVQ